VNALDKFNIFIDKTKDTLDSIFGNKPEGADYFNPHEEVEFQEGRKISYKNLVSLVEEKQGKLEIDLTAILVGTLKETDGGYQGFGYGWTDQMYGQNDGITLYTYTHVVKKKAHPTYGYKGTGFAWAEIKKCNFGGNKFRLKQTKIHTENTSNEPGFQAMGYSSVDEMEGTLGKQLKVTFKRTLMDKRDEHSALYQGCGEGWTDKARVTIELV